MKYNLQINVEATNVEELHHLLDQAIAEAKETINEYGIPGQRIIAKQYTRVCLKKPQIGAMTTSS